LEKGEGDELRQELKSSVAKKNKIVLGVRSKRPSKPLKLEELNKIVTGKTTSNGMSA
jgi:hypothetical protein